MGHSIAVGRGAGACMALRPADLRSWPCDTKIKTRLEERRGFDATAFLDSAGVRRKILEYGTKEVVFTQGDLVKKVMYIQKGEVKLTVVNSVGKEAVVAVLGPGDIVGVGCLAGRPIALETATTITATTLFIVEKEEMVRVLREQREFSDRFIAYLLTRTIRTEEDLMDQLFNSSEKRLARALLLLTRLGEQGQPQKALPEVSQEMLAEMIGTTRSRVNRFMNKFRKLGFIDYSNRQRGLQINKSLLSVVNCEGSERDGPVRSKCSLVPGLAPERNRMIEATRRYGGVCLADSGNN